MKKQHGGAAAKKYKNLVFDIGNVLVENRYVVALENFGLAAEAAEDVYEKVFRESKDLWKLYDLGSIGKEALAKEYASRYPEYASEIAWLIDRGEDYSLYFPELYEVIDQIRSLGCGIYIISNYPKDFFENLEEKSPLGPFLREADGMAVSFRVNLTKPDPEIYRALYDSCSIRPGESIFFDDKKENVEAARETGMDAVVVKSPSDLRDRLVREFLEGTDICFSGE